MTDRAESSLPPHADLPPNVEQVVSGLMGYGPEKIILFGSAARGDTDEYSDLDLIVIKKTDKRFVERMVEAGTYISPEIAVDVFVYTPEEFQSMIEEGNPFVEAALKDGKVLYDKWGSDFKSVAIAATSGTGEQYFMKTPLETAKRWLAQAEHNLRTARLMLENNLWAMACFHAEQTAQLALKAYLFRQGRRFVNVHSIHTLAEESTKYDSTFTPMIDYGIVLDRYYLATRYPDTLPAPAIPYQSFTRQEAQQALGFATEMVDLVRAKVPAASPGPEA